MDLYVLVAERDSRHVGEGRPIVWEQYLDKGAATLRRVEAKKADLGKAYGKISIAKLVFVDEPRINWRDIKAALLPIIAMVLVATAIVVLAR